MDRSKRVAAIRWLLLPLILLTAGYLRFTGLNWDEGQWIHPDEGHMRIITSVIRMPDRLSLYFDTHHSPLNCLNSGYQYSYGTLPLFLTRWTAEWLDRGCGDSPDRLSAAAGRVLIGPSASRCTSGTFTGPRSAQVGRFFSALADLGTVALIYLIARRLYGEAIGLLAAALGALTAFLIQQAHFFTVDSMSAFFTTLTACFAVRAGQSKPRGGPSWLDFGLAGLATGLATACKISAIWAALLVVLAGVGWWLQAIRAQSRRSLLSPLIFLLPRLLLAGLLSLVAFRLAQPYAFEGPGFLGLQLSPEWLERLGQIAAEQSGKVDLPPGQQWTDRAPILFPWINMVVWGMGLPLGLIAWAGWAVVGYRLWRGEHIHLVLWVWGTLFFLYQSTRWVKAMRYFLSLYPLFVIFAACLLVHLARSSSRWRRRLGLSLATLVVVSTALWAGAVFSIYLRPNTRVAASRWIYANIPPGVTVANEHWDWGLPLPVDGHNPFAGMYTGIEMTNYDEDTPEKLVQLLDRLDQADYLFLASNRLYASISRLPARYPVTTAYYRALFAGDLGFELVADFTSCPAIGPFQFPDQETPYPLMEAGYVHQRQPIKVSLPPAEEAFSVYDHPRVLIFHKTARYNREQAQAMLTEGVEWGRIAHGLNPRDLPEWRREQARQKREADRFARQQERWQRTRERTNGLLLTGEQRQVQESGGTWVFLFNRNSLSNRWPTLFWLLLLGLLGLAALPLTLALFHHLPDRGYILARPVGVLLLGWLSWMLTNLTPLHYSRGTILLAFGLIASCSGASLLLPGQRRRLLDLWRGHRRTVLFTEALFLLFFFLFWLIRRGNPDLWHPWMGGEKPMDFAYLNAILKSTEFPPYDPWFAGGYLNYYYFGQVLVGTLIKLVGIVPNVAYNLAIPTWFAMTAMGAFSVTCNLVARRDSTLPSRAVLFGVVGALFVAVLGNLGEVHLLLLKAAEGVMTTFQSTIPGLVGLVRLIIGSFEVIFGGKALPVAINEWYWNASRAIPAAPYESVITEFPFFTFLYADLHAHLIAMPLTFVSLSLALAVVRGAGKGGLLPLLLWGLTIGALRTTNTWDVPPHLLVALGALVIGEFARRGRLSWRLIGAVAWQLGLLFLLSWRLLYWPFWTHYAPIYTSIAVWNGSRTALWAYLIVHGLFLFLIISYLCARTLSRRERDPLLRRLALTIRYRHAADRLRRAARIAGVRGLPPGCAVWIGLAILALVEVVFLVPGLTSFTRANPEWVAQGAYAYRGLVVFALGLPLGVLGWLLLFRRNLEPEERLWAFLVLLGLAMSLGVEVIVLQGDIGRMNTVFKFYLQVWLMWGVAAAVALAWLLPRLERWRSGRGWWLGGLALLLACAALYPPLAASAKVRDRFDPDLGPGLDGWAYMQTAHYFDPNNAQYDLKWDLEAIRWLTDNVIGSPVILEGNTPEYRWGSRYSVNTGLPTVLGWNWHQRQQRGPLGEEEVRQRLADIATIYNTPLSSLAEELLRRYRVRYIIVGPLERAYYELSGLAKFEEMAAGGRLRVVFRNEGVTIYQADW